jgi:hypothetical protein
MIAVGAAWFVSNGRNRERRWDGEYAPRDHGRWRYPERGGSNRFDDARRGVSRASENTREYGARARERARGWVDGAEREVGDIAGRVRHFAEREAEQVRGLAHDVSERSGRVANRARERTMRTARDTWEWSRRSAEAHPLTVVAGAVAAGVFTGLLIPETRRESELLGPERERLFGEAKEMYGDAKEAARDLSHTAKETAREVTSTLKNGLSGATG